MALSTYGADLCAKLFYKKLRNAVNSASRALSDDHLDDYQGKAIFNKREYDLAMAKLINKGAMPGQADDFVDKYLLSTARDLFNEFNLTSVQDPYFDSATYAFNFWVTTAVLPDKLDDIKRALIINQINADYNQDTYIEKYLEVKDQNNDQVLFEVHLDGDDAPYLLCGERTDPADVNDSDAFALCIDNQNAMEYILKAFKLIKPYLKEKSQD